MQRSSRQWLVVAGQLTGGLAFVAGCPKSVGLGAGLEEGTTEGEAIGDPRAQPAVAEGLSHSAYGTVVATAVTAAAGHHRGEPLGSFGELVHQRLGKAQLLHQQHVTADTHRGVVAAAFASSRSAASSGVCTADQSGECGEPADGALR